MVADKGKSMNKEDIFRMAQEAGFEGCAELTWEDVICTEELIAFAKLVAQHEREACADIAENWNSNGMPRTGVANEIRARGQA
jgi:hypothetical protein